MKMDLHEVAAFFVETVRHAERSKQASPRYSREAVTAWMESRKLRAVK